jgi:hypothetical protein
MKVKIEETQYVDSDIKLPFYAYREGEDEDCFVMITETHFSMITFKPINEISFWKRDHRTEHVHIAATWVRNRCDEEAWNEALASAKDFVNNDI